LHSALPSPTPSGGVAIAFSAPSTLDTLSCSGTRLAWNGDDKSGRAGEIWTAQIDGSALAPLAHTAHGGYVNYTAVAADWVVYLEIQTDAETPRGEAWYLEAVSAKSGATMELARSDEATAAEVPQPSVTGTTVVWDHLTDAGAKVVTTFDLATRTRVQLPLPTSVYPVRPYLDASRLIFLDNGPTANRNTQIWLFRAGYVTLFDLTSHQLTRMATPLTAYYLEVSGGVATYIVRQPKEQSTILYRIDLHPGARPVEVGLGETPMYRTASGIIAYLPDVHHMRLYRFDGPTMDLPDAVQFGYAMAPCAGSLYFVQGTSQIFKLSL